jgi:multidrug resistance efflux pump
VSGFIEADEIRVGSRVGGRVERVHVAEGDQVTRGSVLVDLEPFDLLNRLAQTQAELAARTAEYEKLAAGYRAEEVAQAKARVAQLAARLEELKNGPRKEEIAAGQAQSRLAKSRLELAQSEMTRDERLFQTTAITKEEYDRTVQELRVAEETVATRSAELDALLEGTRAEVIAQAQAQLEEAQQAFQLAESGFRQEEIKQAHAAQQAAQAAVGVVQDQLKELKITAPADSVVEAIDLQPGDLVPAGAAVISLADRSYLWVRSYLPENELWVQIGHKVRVTVDSFPNRSFAGRVVYIAREAEFRPGNVQTPEERAKQVFRIKVAIDEGLDVLRPGMVADVWLRSE